MRDKSRTCLFEWHWRRGLMHRAIHLQCQHRYPLLDNHKSLLIANYCASITHLSNAHGFCFTFSSIWPTFYFTFSIFLIIRHWIIWRETFASWTRDNVYIGIHGICDNHRESLLNKFIVTTQSAFWDDLNNSMFSTVCSFAFVCEQRKIFKTFHSISFLFSFCACSECHFLSLGSCSNCSCGCCTMHHAILIMEKHIFVPLSVSVPH